MLKLSQRLKIKYISLFFLSLLLFSQSFKLYSITGLDVFSSTRSLMNQSISGKITKFPGYLGAIFSSVDKTVKFSSKLNLTDLEQVPYLKEVSQFYNVYQDVADVYNGDFEALMHLPKTAFNIANVGLTITGYTIPGFGLIGMAVSAYNFYNNYDKYIKTIQNLLYGKTHELEETKDLSEENPFTQNTTYLRCRYQLEKNIPPNTSAADFPGMYIETWAEEEDLLLANSECQKNKGCKIIDDIKAQGSVTSSKKYLILPGAWSKKIAGNSDDPHGLVGYAMIADPIKIQNICYNALIRDKTQTLTFNGKKITFVDYIKDVLSVEQIEKSPEIMHIIFSNIIAFANNGVSIIDDKNWPFFFYATDKDPKTEKEIATLLQPGEVRGISFNSKK